MSSPDRDQRLAAKLRENLKRRKAQAKARSSHGGETSEGENEQPSRVQAGHIRRPPKADD